MQHEWFAVCLHDQLKLKLTPEGLAYLKAELKVNMLRLEFVKTDVIQKYYTFMFRVSFDNKSSGIGEVSRSSRFSAGQFVFRDGASTSWLKEKMKEDLGFDRFKDITPSDVRVALGAVFITIERTDIKYLKRKVFKSSGGNQPEELTVLKSSESQQELITVSEPAEKDPAYIARACKIVRVTREEVIAVEEALELTHDFDEIAELTDIDKSIAKRICLVLAYGG